MRCGAAISAENYVETWTLLCKPCDAKFHEERREEMTPEQIVSKWIETEWLSHDPAIKDAEEAIVAGLVADIKALVEAERDIYMRLVADAIRREDTLFHSVRSTTLDLMATIRARSNASTHSAEPAEK